MFSLIIRDLIVNAHIGITDAERAQAQRLCINVTIELAATVNPQRDDMRETVDYDAVVQSIRQLADTSDFNLLETFAQKVSEFCLSDPRSCSAAIQVEKLDLYNDARSAGIQLKIEKIRE